MQSTSIPALMIRRVLKASPQRVYQAWTDPALAQQFMCPSEVTVPEIALDVRVGGSYRIVMQREDGEQLVVRGTYRDVRPNERLSMTWQWEEDDPKDEYETLLTIDLTPHGSGTELTLTHEHFQSAQSRTNHEGGWNSMLDKMDGLS